jgi:acyl-CoA reductase-like NAD-dependent aldehyde dehydrogenase
LAVYLFTRETALEKRVIAETQSGGVCVNDTILQILGNELPFGGVGGSGMGSYHGRASFDCFSHRRTVMRRKFGIDPQFRYPPAKTPLKWLKHILRYMG